MEFLAPESISRRSVQQFKFCGRCKLAELVEQQAFFGACNNYWIQITISLLEKIWNC
jgi:hypothetical protein